MILPLSVFLSASRERQYFLICASVTFFANSSSSVFGLLSIVWACFGDAASERTGLDSSSRTPGASKSVTMASTLILSVFSLDCFGAGGMAFVTRRPPLKDKVDCAPLAAGPPKVRDLLVAGIVKSIVLKGGLVSV